MQLKALAAIVSVAFTLGVQAAPNSFDHAAGVRGVLKRSYSHGQDMSQVSKRATALVAKKRDSNHQRRAGKRCKSKTNTTPTPQQPETTPPTPQQPETTPPTPETTPTPQQPETTPDTVAPVSSPAPEQNSGTNISPPANNNDNNTGSGSTSLDDAAQQWLDQHNQARAQHGAAPLTWSSELATFGENHANGCVFEHTKDNSHGENLAAATGSLTPAASVKMWMDEVGGYTLVDSLG